MNTRILLSGLSIVSAMAMVGSIAYASFTSVASNNGNTFGSGNLELRIDGLAGSTSTPKFTVTNTFPGDVRTQVITLSNTGTLPASSTKLVSIGHSTTTSPDLGDKLTLNLYNDVDGSGTINAGDSLAGSSHITNAVWSNIDLGFGLAAGGSHQVIAEITFDADSDDTFQSTNSTFHLNFQANQ